MLTDLLDPFGWIAGSWDWASDDGGILFYLVALIVASAHVLIALALVAFVVHLVSSFAGGVRTGLRNSRTP